LLTNNKELKKGKSVEKRRRKAASLKQEIVMMVGLPFLKC